MFNNTYGDEGLTKLFQSEISKGAIELDFLGDLKEVNAYIKLSLNYFDPFKYYFINDTLTKIIKTLIIIENDYSKGINEQYEVNFLLDLEKKINELKDKININKTYSDIGNKQSAIIEIIYTKCLRLERSYYKAQKEFKFQSYLNRLNDYFYVLKEYVNREM